MRNKEHDHYLYNLSHAEREYEGLIARPAVIKLGTIL